MMAVQNRWLVFLAAALIVASPVLAQDGLQVNIFGHPAGLSPEDEAQVNFLINSGREAFLNGDYDGAVTQYRLALSIDPNNDLVKEGLASALGYRGAIAAEYGQYEAAQADFAAATAIYPAIVDVYPFLVQRGYLAWLVNDLEGALADFEAAVALDDSALAHEYRAHANFNLGNDEAALEDYNIAIAAGLEPPLSFYNRGVILDSMGDFDAALADFSRVIEIDPTWADAYLYRASIYAEQGDIENATPDYFAWIQSIETARDTLTTPQDGEPITLTLTQGLTYYIPFTGRAERRVTVTAEAITDGLDPLIVILNSRGEPIIASDDISAEDFNSAIEDFLLPTGREFTLVVSHAGGGGEGDVEVTLTVE
jgi:tetratricopeptide (TPR) repeat protein